MTVGIVFRIAKADSSTSVFMSIYFCPRINTKIYIEGLEEKIKNIEMKWFERLGNSLNKKLPPQLIVTQGKTRGSTQTDFHRVLLHFVE